MKDNIPGKNPFKVPENYFEEVNRKIVSATSESEPAEVRRGLYRRLKPYFAVAASIAAFILISYTAVKIFLPENRNGKLPEISTQEFYESYLNDIDLLTLEEQAESFFQPENLQDVNNSEITEYLLLENINENEIYELL